MIADHKPYSSYKGAGVLWLGAVPEHWSTLPLKRWVTINAEVLPETTVPDRSFRYVDIGSVGTGILIQKPQRIRFADAPSRARRVVRNGDTLVSTVRTYLKAIYFVDGEADQLVCSTGFAVLTPRVGTVPQFVSYLVRSNAFTDRVAANSVGIAYPAIAESRFGSLHVSVPPFPEQAAIVRFLDHADRRIRRYIRAKQKLITLLEEQKQAIVHEAVTRGIGSVAKLKATGNTWFPDVPARWDVMPLRRVITRSVDGPHHSPEYLDHGIPFLSARNIKVDRWSLEDVKFISQIDYETFCQRVKPARGDVLYTKGGTTGVARAVDLDYPFQVWVHVAVLKLRKARILPRYLATGLNSPRCYEQSQLFTRGATNQDLGLGRMKDIVIPIPPLADQSDIIERVAAIEDRIYSGIKAALHEIELLREYRTRLLADVVTGKLDVREAAARLPDEVKVADEFDALPEATETCMLDLEDATESPEEFAMENEVII